MNLKNYIQISNAIVKLLEPLAEVVIHDLKQDQICYIKGNLSKRKIGDPSLLDFDFKKINQQELERIENVTYPKLNFDGRLVKSISVLLKESNQNKFLLCINCDSSIFEQIRSLTDIFLPNHSNKQPEILFKNDWQERLHIAINQYLKQQKWSFNRLNNSQKKQLITHLFSINAFSQKKSPDYLAKVLNMGRATIFNHLKKLKNNNHDQ